MIKALELECMKMEGKLDSSPEISGTLHKMVCSEKELRWRADGCPDESSLNQRKGEINNENDQVQVQTQAVSFSVFERSIDISILVPR